MDREYFELDTDFESRVRVAALCLVSPVVVLWFAGDTVAAPTLLLLTLASLLLLGFSFAVQQDVEFLRTQGRFNLRTRLLGQRWIRPICDVSAVKGVIVQGLASATRKKDLLSGRDSWVVEWRYAACLVVANGLVRLADWRVDFSEAEFDAENHAKTLQLEKLESAPQQNIRIDPSGNLHRRTKRVRFLSASFLSPSSPFSAPRWEDVESP